MKHFLARPRGRQVRRIVAASALLFSASQRRAGANSRYPAANQLVVDPKDSHHLVVRSTFGVMESADQGSTWSWICEGAVGIAQGGDPGIAVTSNGTVLVGLETGMSLSTDRGCHWDRARLSGLNITDVSVDRAMPSIAVASASNASVADVHYFSQVQRSMDDGQDWLTVGPRLDDFYTLTIDVAPSDGRLYLSGILTNFTPAIQRSDDGGMTWQRQSLAMGDSRGGYLAAIDKENSSILYVRATASDVRAVDSLLVSRDAGQSWTEIFSTAGGLLGVALSPDGSKIAAGGPSAGLSIARTTDFTFEKVSETVVKCLSWTIEGLYVCGDNVLDGFAVGLSRDDGVSISPLLKFETLVPVNCGGGTPVDTECPPAWPSVAATIGADAGVSPDSRIDARPSLTGVQAGGGCTVAGIEEPSFAGWVGVAAVLAAVTRRSAVTPCARRPRRRPPRWWKRGISTKGVGRAKRISPGPVGWAVRGDHR
jgi:hypothetical protein